MDSPIKIVLMAVKLFYNLGDSQVLVGCWKFSDIDSPEWSSIWTHAAQKRTSKRGPKG